MGRPGVVGGDEESVFHGDRVGTVLEVDGGDSCTTV